MPRHRKRNALAFSPIAGSDGERRKPVVGFLTYANATFAERAHFLPMPDTLLTRAELAIREARRLLDERDDIARRFGGARSERQLALPTSPTAESELRAPREDRE